MTAWHTGRLAAFDLETTSPDPTEARIVTACVALVGGGEDPVVREWLLDPGVEIPEAASAIHGVTTERARTEGMDAGLAVSQIDAALMDAWSLGLPVVAFNASYDLTVMDCELGRRFGMRLNVKGPVVDPFVIDREVDKYRKGKRTLGVMVDHYGVTLDGAHEAQADALAAARVAWRIACRFPDIADLSLMDLHARQVEWHAERQADFAAYLRRSGKPADDVCGDWPIRQRNPLGVTA